MGFTELLTIVFVVLKLIGVISWSWWLVLLPEIIASGLYVILLVCACVVNARAKREIIKFTKR